MYMCVYTVSTHNSRNDPCFSPLTNKYLLPLYSNQAENLFQKVKFIRDQPSKLF